MGAIPIVASFGGGLIGALIGGLPAFIFAGFIGLAGVGIIAAGGPDTILNSVVFGTMFGPHIAFAGGIAAAAYAANKKKVLESGMDILHSPSTIKNDPSVLFVGGVFGIIGFLVNELFIYINAPVDTVATTVFVSAILTRFIFGHSGLVGDTKPAGVEKRKYVDDSRMLSFIILYSFGIGIVTSYIVDLTQIEVFGFVVSAALLIFLQTGFNIPCTHHITLVAGYATIATGSVIVGTVFAIIAGIVGNVVERTFNSYCDTHIDPPATTIFICSLFIFTVL